MQYEIRVSLGYIAKIIEDSRRYEDLLASAVG